MIKEFKKKDFLLSAIKRALFLKVLFLFSTTSFALDFGEKELKDLLNKKNKNGKKIQSIEELLPKLPQELLSNFTFVFDSRSPFKGSITPEEASSDPFSLDSRFILTFTGASGKPGFDIVESIEFDNKTSKFKFYGHDLKNPKKYNADLTPKSCQKCHGTDPRPIFDSYPLWPGFYGAVLDSFPKGVITSEREKVNYMKFLSQNSKKGLYKYLNFKKGSRVTPFLEPELLILNENKEAVTLSTKFKPNERFGIGLTALNKKRIFRKIKSSPHYEKYKKEILFELLDCGVSQINDSDIKKVKKLVRKENMGRIKRMKAVGRDNFHELLQMQELIFFKQLAQVDWVADKLKVNRDDWSLAMEVGSYSFFDGILSGVYEGKNYYMKEDIIFEMLKELSEKEAAYKSFFKVGYTLGAYDLDFIDKISFTEAVKSCPTLKKDLKKE